MAAPARKRLRRIVNDEDDEEDPPVLSPPAPEIEARDVSPVASDRPQHESRAVLDEESAESAENFFDEESDGESSFDRRAPAPVAADPAPVPAASDPAPAASDPAQGSIEALLAAEEEKHKALLQQQELHRKLADLRAQNQQLEGHLESSLETATADKAKVKETAEPPPPPKPPEPPPKPMPPMAPSCWGLDEADDEAEAKYAEESWPRGHADDMQIDPPIGLQGDVYAELLWRLDWLLPRMDARTANQKPADHRDFSNAPAVRTMPHHVAGFAGDQHHFDPSAGLPDGWTRMYSKSNPGKHYYFHKRTGKTSWEKPLF